MLGEVRGFFILSSAPKSTGPLIFLLNCGRRRRHKKMPIPIRNATKATEPTTAPTIALVLIGTFVGLEDDIRKSWIRPWFYIQL